MPIAQIREISFFEISSQLILPYTLQCMWQLFCMSLSKIRSAENHKAVQLLNILMNEFDQSGFRKKCKEAEAVYKKAL